MLYDFDYSYLTVYDDGGENGEDNFYLALSDQPFDADGYEADGSNVAYFDIYASDGTDGILPVGSYRFDDYNYVEGTFSSGTHIETSEGEFIHFSDGTIEVSKTDDVYTFVATLTGKNDGLTYRVTYTGTIAEPGSSSEPVALEMKYHQVMYYEGYDSSQSDEFCLSLSDMPFADDYGTGSEGSYVAWLDIYAPNGTSGVLPEGTYNYADSYTRPPMSFVSGSTITYPGEDYGVRVDPALHEEVLARYKKLNLAPYKGFVNPRMTLVKDDAGAVVDVSLDYTEGYAEQMLRYSRDYSFLPSYNE